MSDADLLQESRALASLDRFIKQNMSDLIAIAYWGDGRCGFIAERIANAVLGPEPETPPPARSRAISARVRRVVMERDRYRCVACGSFEDLRIDHVHPWSLGGSNDAVNLQTLCHPCNQAKGARVEGVLS